MLSRAHKNAVRHTIYVCIYVLYMYVYMYNIVHGPNTLS